MAEDTSTELGRYGTKRRNVLRTLGTAGFAGVALTGRAVASHGKTGGSMLTAGEPEVGVPFTITDVLDDLDFPASCRANRTRRKRYTELEIVYPSMCTTQSALIRENKMKHLNTIDEVEYEFRAKRICREASSLWRGSFSPA